MTRVGVVELPCNNGRASHCFVIQGDAERAGRCDAFIMITTIVIIVVVLACFLVVASVVFVLCYISVRLNVEDLALVSVCLFSLSLVFVCVYACLSVCWRRHSPNPANT